MRLLVTGASGLVGQYVVPALVAQGHSVRACVHSRPNERHLQHRLVEVFRTDVRDIDAVRPLLEGVDGCIHLAAAMQGDWETHRTITVEGTRNLLRAANEARVRRFVHLSSLCVYERSACSDGDLITESHPWIQHPQKSGNYARAKLLAEAAVWSAAHEPGSQLDVCVLRPGLVLGSGEDLIFPEVGFRVGGLVLMLGLGGRHLPLVCGENLATAVRVAATRSTPIGGAAFNLVDAPSTTARDYLRALADHAGVRLRPVPVPVSAYALAAAAAEMLQRFPGASKLGGMNRYRMGSASRSVLYSTSAARRELSWRPTVSLADALARCMSQSFAIPPRTPGVEQTPSAAVPR